jgi:hypothetical protein
MQLHLPRELRDMIHLHLLEDSCVHVYSHYLQSNRFPARAYFTPSTFLQQHMITASGFEHLFDTRQTDATTFQELTEAWYKYTRFVFQTSHLIKQFFAPERWHHTTPPCSLVGRVEAPWPFPYYDLASLFVFRMTTEIVMVEVRLRDVGSEVLGDDGVETRITASFGGMTEVLERLLEMGYRMRHRLASEESSYIG